MAVVPVILHCSASKFGNAALISKWHTTPKSMGGKNEFSQIGYHYVILNGFLAANKYNAKFDGHLETGRALGGDAFFDKDEIGAHTAGYNKSVGICLIGESGMFTPEQFSSLEMLLLDLRAQFTEIEVYQHSDLDFLNKAFCAGLRPSIMNRLKNLVNT